MLYKMMVDAFTATLMASKGEFVKVSALSPAAMCHSARSETRYQMSAAASSWLSLARSCETYSCCQGSAYAQRLERLCFESGALRALVAVSHPSRAFGYHLAIISDVPHREAVEVRLQGPWFCRHSGAQPILLVLRACGHDDSGPYGAC